MRQGTRVIWKLAVSMAFCLGVAGLWFGCGKTEEGEASKASTGKKSLTGTVNIDGSSTVFPITEAVAEEFRKECPQVRVAVGTSGTGGGFKKFALGETDINDASRPIRATEMAAAKAKNIDFIELPVGFDGLSIVVNSKNDWVDHLTIEELRKIWSPDSKVKTWKEVRSSFPDKEIRLFGPGHDSGTFDYFTEAINGKVGACRADYTASEDDNTLVVGVAGEPNALGYFGFAYYEENKDKIKLVPIDGGKGPIAPTEETIRLGTYAPLSRPLFIYVVSTAADRPEVKAFVEYYLENASLLVPDVGYVKLPDASMELVKQRFANRTTGSMYEGAEDTTHMALEELLKK